MTIQVYSDHAKSKATLTAALNSNPQAVRFYDPSLFNSRIFRASEMKPGERFPVVMDPQTRRRFAEVERRADGSFRVL